MNICNYQFTLSGFHFICCDCRTVGPYGLLKNCIAVGAATDLETSPWVCSSGVLQLHTRWEKDAKTRSDGIWTQGLKPHSLATTQQQHSQVSLSMKQKLLVAPDDK